MHSYPFFNNYAPMKLIFISLSNRSGKNLDKSTLFLEFKIVHYT